MTNVQMGVKSGYNQHSEKIMHILNSYSHVVHPNDRFSSQEKTLP